VPHDAEDYIHRIGRTARANRQGVGITFVSEKDQDKFGMIEQFLEKEIDKMPMPEGLGEGPAYNPQLKGRGGRRRPNSQRQMANDKSRKSNGIGDNRSNDKRLKSNGNGNDTNMQNANGNDGSQKPRRYNNHRRRFNNNRNHGNHKAQQGESTKNDSVG
jgi:superfamily II DNA/RNA helicase